MLVEIWNWSAAGFFNPADPATYCADLELLVPARRQYPHRCFHIDDADWRYLRRFMPRRGRWHRPGMPDRQTYYAVPPEYQALLAGAEPYRQEAADAG